MTNVTDQAHLMLSLGFRTFEFLAFHLLITIVDWVSRLPRGSTSLPGRRLPP
jgi:hypothetical protein